MLTRPFFNHSTAKLRKESESQWGNPDVLHSVYTELLYRERKAALLLRELIEERLLVFTEYFPWPTTDAPNSTNSLDTTIFTEQVGLLAFVGYRVGQNGVTPQKRRALLEDVYLRRVPPVNSQDYMSTWGKPRTSTRLKKLANVVASNARHAKRNSSERFSIAISEWEADLAYMKKKFYVGVYSFKWPKTAA